MAERDIRAFTESLICVTSLNFKYFIFIIFTTYLYLYNIVILLYYYNILTTPPRQLDETRGYSGRGYDARVLRRIYTGPLLVFGGGAL